MCGIVGANGLQRARSKGRVAELGAKVAQEGLSVGEGIAHTRWVTLVVPAERNAQPHISGVGGGA